MNRSWVDCVYRQQLGRLCVSTKDTLNTIRATEEDDWRVIFRQIEFLMKGEMGDPISMATISRILNNKLGFCKVVLAECLASSLTNKKNCTAAALTLWMRYVEGEDM